MRRSARPAATTEPVRDPFQPVEQYLQSRGLRHTEARRKILDAVFGSHEHFTAEGLLDKMRRRGDRVSRASVYRTLSMLCEGGFVESREFQRGQMMYESMLGQHHHDHLICTSCGHIIEFENQEIERLQEETAKRHRFRIEHHSLRIYGRCAKCSRAPR
jgi:Fur family transcriptional regulator, ferric uptake regulator